MNRIVAFILSFILILSSLVTAYAEDVTHPTDEPIIEEYVDLISASATLRVNGNTAFCHGSASSRVNTDSIHLWMYLQKQTSAGWTTVYTWYEHDIRLAVLDESRSGLSLGTYRVRVYVRVYDANGSFVESANAYSKLKTVS